jgi:hypothetical protein
VGYVSKLRVSNPNDLISPRRQAEEVVVQGVIRDDSGGPLGGARDPGTGGSLVALTVRWRPPARGPAPARYRVMLLPLGGGNATAVALADVPHAGSRYMLQVSS